MRFPNWRRSSSDSRIPIQTSGVRLLIPEILSKDIGEEHGALGWGAAGGVVWGTRMRRRVPVRVKPLLEQGHGRLEFISDQQQEIDVVDIPAAVEAMGEVVAGIDGGEKFAAVGANEAQPAFDAFGARSGAAQALQRDVHGQVVAQGMQEVAGDHGGTPGSEIGEVAVFSPVRLDQDAVDDVNVDAFVRGTDGFEHAAQDQVAGLAQDAVGRADDQVERGLGEGVVPEADAIEFGEDEGLHVLGV